MKWLRSCARWLFGEYSLYRIYLVVRAYGPGYTNWSVDTIVRWHAFEKILEEGRLRLFGFTRGQSEHERLFSTHAVQRANVSFVPNRLRNSLLVRSHAFGDNFSGSGAKRLIGLGLGPGSER